MFDRNKSGDYVTRDQADEYIRDLKRQAANSFVSREDAATFQSMFSALEERVQELENLASRVRGTGAVVPAAARRVPASDALTKSDAEQALAQLKREGAEQFRQLSAKIDTAVHEFVRGGNATPAAPVQGGTTGVDYGAIAFGLSEIARKVRGAVGAEGFGGSQAMADYYRDTVQYFADVFAKSDASFDADAFKRQSGV